MNESILYSYYNNRDDLVDKRDSRSDGNITSKVIVYCDYDLDIYLLICFVNSVLLIVLLVWMNLFYTVIIIIETN